MIVDVEKYPDTTYDDFEPYTGGIPSPNPDYPQEIKSVVNPTVKVCGKNLLKATLGTTTQNGVTCTNNGDGTYTLNGTASVNTHFQIVQEGTNISNGTYKVTGCPSGGSPEKYFIRCGSEGIAAWNDTGDGCTSIISNNRMVYRISIIAGVTVNNILFKPMIVDASLYPDATYDDFEPYHEQTVTLPYTLNAIPVLAGGNVTIDGQQYVSDYFDVERGKLVRMCKEIDFTKITPVLYGLNPETISEECRFVYSQLGLKQQLSSVTYLTGAGYMDHSYLNSGGTWGDDRIGIFSHGQDVDKSQISIRVPLNTGRKTKEYFESIGGCKGVFIAAAPEEIDLTPEQIQSFKSLATNYPVTNIEVSSDQLDEYTVFNYPVSMENGWNYVKQQIGDTRNYIYDMDARTQDTDLQAAEAYVNSEYAVALTELEV